MFREKTVHGGADGAPAVAILDDATCAEWIGC